MPEGDGAAVDVELVDVEVQIPDHGQDLPGERLVDLEEVDVPALHAALAERPPSCRPPCRAAARMAGAGPIPMREGSTPTTDQERMRPSGFHPFSRAFSAVERIIIAAPSTIPEALPAVTKPSLSNAVGSPARSSMVVSGRRWSSLSMTLDCFPSPPWTGATSWLILHEAHAWPACCCERMAN